MASQQGQGTINQAIPISPSVGDPNALPSTNVKIRFDVAKFFENYSDGGDGSLAETYNPVCQKNIGQVLQNNIEIRGKFRTNYDPVESSTHGGYSYITVRKPTSGKADAITGYGIAWRPSSFDATKLSLTGIASGTTVTLTTGDGTNLGSNTVAFISNIIDDKTYYVPFEFERTDDVLSNCAFPTNIAPSGSVEILVCEPNLFIVDNDLINGDMYMNNFIEFPGNTLAYIRSAIVKIEKDTDYYFKLQISSDNAIDFYLETVESLLDTADAKISCGARTPMSEYIGTSNMNAFGISVVDTTGYRWYYDDILIRRLDGEYPIGYFEFDVSTLTDMVQIYLKGYGTGYGGDGLKIYVWETELETWEQVGENTFSTASLSISNDVDKNLYAADGTLKVMIRTAYPSGVDTEATLNIDYIDVRGSYNSGVHIGGCVDVMIDDANLVSGTLDVTPDTTDYINIIDFSDRVVVWISSVVVKDSSPSIALLEGVDYIWIHNNENYERTDRGQNIIKFNPSITSDVTISYYYSPLVKNLQNWAHQSHIHFKGQDTLIKHKNIHLLSVEATTGDDTTQAEIASMVGDYVKTLVNSDGNYTLTFNGIKEYLYIQSVRKLTTLKVTDTYRDNGVKNKVVLNVSGDYVTINMASVFRMEGDM